MEQVPPRRNILLVDDDPDARLAVHQCIRDRHDLNIEEVVDGPSAFDAIAGATTPFDLVILDAELPGFGALEVLSRLRAHGWDGRPPVVVFSGASDPLLPAMVMERGAAAFVEKPVTFSAFCKAVRHIVDDYLETPPRQVPAPRSKSQVPPVPKPPEAPEAPVPEAPARPAPTPPRTPAATAPRPRAGDVVNGRTPVARTDGLPPATFAGLPMGEHGRGHVDDVQEPRPYPYVARIRVGEVEVEVRAEHRNDLVPLLDQVLERARKLAKDPPLGAELRPPTRGRK